MISQYHTSAELFNNEPFLTLKSFIGSEVELITVSENRAKPDLCITGELGQYSSGRYYVRFGGGKFQFSAISLDAAWEAAWGRIVRVRI